MIRRHGQRVSTVNNNSSPQLRDLVIPQQAHEIGLVVSTLAKAYAQRLVTAAIAERNKSQHVNSIEPLASEHILKAHESRQAQGLDPGFFLQARQDYLMLSSTTARTNTTGTADDIDRLAALAAQEEYDKLHETNKPTQGQS